MRQAIAKRRGFNAYPTDRTANGDGFELWYHRGHQTLAHTGIDQRLISHHAFGFDNVGIGVDCEDVVEFADIQQLVLCAAVTEKIGGLFAQAYAPAGVIA